MSNLGPNRRAVLTVLSSAPGLRLDTARLAELTGLSRKAVSNAVDPLRELGLVDRERREEVAEHKGHYLHFITDAGRVALVEGLARAPRIGRNQAKILSTLVELRGASVDSKAIADYARTSTKAISNALRGVLREGWVVRTRKATGGYLYRISSAGRVTLAAYEGRRK